MTQEGQEENNRGTIGSMLMGWGVRKVVHQVTLHLEGMFEPGTLVDWSGDSDEQ